MPETELWILIGVGVIAIVALVVSIGDYLHRHQSPTNDEYRRAQEALKNYEEQQQKHQEYQARYERQLDRQEALLDRIERLVDRLEEKFEPDEQTERT